MNYSTRIRIPFAHADSTYVLYDNAGDIILYTPSPCTHSRARAPRKARRAPADRQYENSPAGTVLVLPPLSKSSPAAHLASRGPTASASVTELNRGGEGPRSRREYADDFERRDALPLLAHQLALDEVRAPRDEAVDDLQPVACAARLVSNERRAENEAEALTQACSPRRPRRSRSPCAPRSCRPPSTRPRSPPQRPSAAPARNTPQHRPRPP